MIEADRAISFMSLMAFMIFMFVITWKIQNAWPRLVVACFTNKKVFSKSPKTKSPYKDMTVEEIKSRENRFIIKIYVIVAVFLIAIFSYLSIQYWPSIHGVEITYRTPDHRFYKTIPVRPSLKVDPAHLYNHLNLAHMYGDVKIQHEINGVKLDLIRCTPIPDPKSLKGYFLKEDRPYWRVPLGECESITDREPPISVDLKNSKLSYDSYRYGKDFVAALLEN